MTEMIPEKINMQCAGQTRDILLQRENKKKRFKNHEKRDDTCAELKMEI